MTHKPQDTSPETFVDLSDRDDVCQGHGQFNTIELAQTVCALTQETGETPCAALNADKCGWWDRVIDNGAFYAGDMSPQTPIRSQK